MSAREIIAEIEALSSDEKAKVIAYVQQLSENKSGATEPLVVRYVDRATAERARNEVFTKHAELLRKLAD
jgi:hypothetical protein